MKYLWQNIPVLENWPSLETQFSVLIWRICDRIFPFQKTVWPRRRSTASHTVIKNLLSSKQWTDEDTSEKQDAIGYCDLQIRDLKTTSTPLRLFLGSLIGMHPSMYPACPLSTLHTNACPCGHRKLSGEDFLKNVPGSTNGDKLPRLMAKTYRGPAYSTHLWRKTLNQQCVLVCRQYKSWVKAKSACAPPPHTVFHSVRTLVELRRTVPSPGVRGRYLVQGVSGDSVLVYKR